MQIRHPQYSERSSALAISKVKRSKKALYNIVTHFIFQVVSLVSGVVTPRLIISNFGSAYNGTISSITQFLSLAGFLTLGVEGATRFALYKHLANDDILGISRVIKETERYMRKVGMALVIYSAVLAVIFPYISDSSIPKIEVTILVILLTLGTFSGYFFSRTYAFLLRADQSEYIVTVFRTVAAILDLIIIIVLIKLDATMVHVRLGVAVVSFLNPILVNAYTKRHYKLVRKCDPDKTALSQRSYAMFHSIANMVHDNTDIFLLTIFTNAKIVSVYAVYYGIVRNIKELARNFTSGLEGAFGSMWAKGEKKQFSRNFKIYEFLMFSFSSVIFTALGVMLLPFIRLYTAGVTDVNYVRGAFAVLVVLAEAVFCVRQPYVTIVQAAGKYKETRNGAAVEAIINLVISLVLVNLIGLEGIIIGTLIANAFRTVQYMLYSYKELLEQKAWNFLKLVLWHLVNSTIALAAYFAVDGFIGQDTWVTWIVSGFVSVIIAGIVTLITASIFFRPELKGAFVFLKRMFKKKRV